VISVENTTNEAPKYKGDWNLNLKFLDYIAYLLTRSGYFAEEADVWHWLKTLEELYRKTGGIVKKPEYKEKLNTIKKALKLSSAQGNSQAIMLNSIAAQEKAIEDLDTWETEYIGLMHAKNLILPKSDRKRGLSELEDEYGLG